MDKSYGEGQLGPDGWDRIGGQDRRDRTDTVEQGNRDGTTVAGQSGMAAGTGPLRQDSWDSSIYSGQLRQVSLGKTERTSLEMTAMLGQQPQESRGQDC